MAVSQYRDFAHRDTLPATWTDAIERFLTARENFVVRRASATTIEVPAGGDFGPAGVMIQGKPRWIEATQNRVVAGAAQVFDVWVVAAANSFAAGAPEVGEIDNTFYGFELRVVATGGAAPAGVLAGGQAIALTRKVATLEWDGAAIVSVTPLARSGPTEYLQTGTLTAAYGTASQVQVGYKGNGRAETLYGLAGDTNLYRAAADTLKTDDAFISAGTQLASVGANQVSSGAVGPSSAAGLLFGSAGDTDLYRSAADTLKTDDAFVAALGYSLGAPLSAPAYQAQQVAAQIVLRNKLLAADANDAFRVLGNGKQEWGPGGAGAIDTNLYRSAVGKLATDGTFLAVGGLASGAATGNSDFANAGVWAAAAGQVSARRAANAAVWRSSVVGDTGDRFTFDTAGLMQWGPSPGTGVFDTNLYRSSADVLRTDDSLVVALDTYARGGIATQIASGDISILGVGGAARAGVVFGSAADTNLYRSAADTLKTDDSLVVAGTLSASDATYQTIETYSSSMGAGVASGGAQIMLRDGTMGNLATRLSMFYFDPAHYAVTGKTTKVRLSVACLPGVTAPGATLTVELWQVTAISGAGIGVLGGAVLTSVPFVTPAANSINAGVSADVSGLAAGAYVVRVAVSGGSSTAAGSDTVFDVAVQVRRN